MADLTIKLLAEMIDEHYRPTPIRKLPPIKRKAYQSDAVAKTRGKIDAALASGTVPVNRQHVRDALTDAALHILLTDGPGADVIREVCASVFGDDADAALSKVTEGKVGPRFFKSS